MSGFHICHAPLVLASASIKIFFKQKIEAGESVSIAGKKISTLADLDAIDEDFFTSAAQSGFTLWPHSGKPVRILLLSRRVV